MFATLLTNRTVIAVGGADARSFLDRLLTGSLGPVSPARASHAALLTPQGKMVAEAVITEIAAEEGGSFLLDVARPQAGDLAAKLAFYRLRADVTIAEVGDEAAVVALWGGRPRRPRPRRAGPAAGGTGLSRHAGPRGRRRCPDRRRCHIGG